MRAARLLPLLTACVASAAPPAPAEPDADRGSWPQWRGPHRDGTSPGAAWPDRLRVERQWAVAGLGPGYAGPIVDGDRVFTVETKDGAREVVRAFARDDGRELWTAEWQGALEVPFFARRNGSWVRSTPATDGERLFVGGMRDRLVCLDVSTGQTLWTLDCMEKLGSPLPAFGLVSSPLVTGGHVYVQAAGSLLKVDKRTGAVAWRVLEDGGGMNSAFSSPVTVPGPDGVQVVVQTRTELCGVEARGGEVRWRTPVKAFRGMNILTPMIHGDAVFTAAHSGRSHLFRVRREPDGTCDVDEAWSVAVQGYMTSPVVIEGHAYFLSRSNRFVCIDLEAGERRWVSPPTGDDYWSLAARGGRILALNDTGRLRLIRAAPEAYEVMDEVEVVSDQTWAHLAVAGSDLYVRSQGSLVALRW